MQKSRFSILLDLQLEKGVLGLGDVEYKVHKTLIVNLPKKKTHVISMETIKLQETFLVMKN